MQLDRRRPARQEKGTDKTRGKLGTRFAVRAHLYGKRRSEVTVCAEPIAEGHLLRARGNNTSPPGSGRNRGASAHVHHVPTGSARAAERGVSAPCPFLGHRRRGLPRVLRPPAPPPPPRERLPMPMALSSTPAARQTRATARRGVRRARDPRCARPRDIVPWSGSTGRRPAASSSRLACLSVAVSRSLSRSCRSAWRALPFAARAFSAAARSSLESPSGSSSPAMRSALLPPSRAPAPPPRPPPPPMPPPRPIPPPPRCAHTTELATSVTATARARDQTQSSHPYGLPTSTFGRPPGGPRHRPVLASSGNALRRKSRPCAVRSAQRPCLSLRLLARVIGAQSCIDSGIIPSI